MRALCAALAVVLAAPAVAAPGDPLPTLDQVTAAGSQWRFDTARGAIRIWVPARYDPATAATIVFVHGYYIDLDAAWRDCRLPEQFALSGLNAMFIAAAAPSGKTEAVVWPTPTALLAAVAAHIDVAMPTQRVVAIGHSGAYRTLASWLSDERLDTLVLLDAVYGDFGFAPWARADPAHRLINIAHQTGANSDRLHRGLPSTTYVDDLAHGLPDAHIVYAKTALGHWEVLEGGVALPLALRAIDVGRVAAAPNHLPLGIPTPRHRAR